MLVSSEFVGTLKNKKSGPSADFSSENFQHIGPQLIHRNDFFRAKIGQGSKNFGTGCTYTSALHTPLLTQALVSYNFLFEHLPTLPVGSMYQNMFWIFRVQGLVLANHEWFFTTPAGH